jgi:hypothetical protein
MTDTPATVTPPPQGWWADAPKPAAAPASPFWRDGPKPAAAPQTEFWKPSAAIGQGGTDAQAQAMADEMVRAGAMTRDAADAKLRADGKEPAVADTRTAAQKQFDASFPVVPPIEFHLTYVGNVPPGTEVSTISEFHTEATSWLSEVGMPPAIGQALVEQAMRTGQRGASMSPPARELWKREQASMFDKIAKTPERAAQLRAYAVQVLDGASKAAGFSNGLRQSPAIYDAMVLLNLGLHGERLAARKAMS